MRVKKELNIEIGRQIRLAREKSALTQEQLAELLDVSTQYISDLERGVVGISVPTLKQLCISLGISSDNILFSSLQDADLAIITEKCRTLPKDKLHLLSNIIDLYIKAVDTGTEN